MQGDLSTSKLMQNIRSAVIILILTAFPIYGLAQNGSSAIVGSFAPPSWQTVDDPEVESKKDVLNLETEDGRQIVYELKPKGQGNRNWRKRHWIYVAEDVSKSAVRVRNSYLTREGELCRKEPKWADWDKSRTELVFVYFCGERATDGRGYLAAVWMAKQGTTLYRVSEEWRGAPYEFGNESTYFWDREELTNLIAIIGSSELN